MTISIYKAEYIFFSTCSTPISPFITITTFFFLKICNSSAQKWQFWQFALNNFKKLILITIYHLSSFIIIKSGLKKIYAFFCLKIKPLMQSANLMLLKLFSLAALLFFPLMCFVLKEIEVLWPCANLDAVEAICSGAFIFFLTQLLLVLRDEYIEPSILHDKRSLIFVVIESSKKKHRTNLRTK